MKSFCVLLSATFTYHYWEMLLHIVKVKNQNLCIQIFPVWPGWVSLREIRWYPCSVKCLLDGLKTYKGDLFLNHKLGVFDFVSISESQSTLQKKGKMENYLLSTYIRYSSDRMKNISIWREESLEQEYVLFS